MGTWLEDLLDVEANTRESLDLVANTSPLVGPELEFTGYSGAWINGIDVANPEESRDYVATGIRLGYSFSDGVTTSGSTTLTSPANGGFAAVMVGAPISGAGIPAGTTVSAVTSATILTMSAAATASASGVRVTVALTGVTDLMYWRHRGARSPTLGIGVTPPSGVARVEIAASAAEPAMETMRLMRGASQTGNVLTLHDSAPIDRLWVDKDFYLRGNHTVGGAVAVKSPNDAAGNALLIAPSDGTTHYAFSTPSGSGNVLRVRNASNNASCYDIGTNGSFRHLSSQLAFFAANLTTKPTVSGSKASGAALDSLLTALTTLGLITNSTSA